MAVVHKQNNVTMQPVCWPTILMKTVPAMAEEIDDVDCVDCLRRLAKDAVLYGRDRKARRQR